MVLWFSLIIAIALAAATLRLWINFTGRAQQFTDEVEQARQLIDSHSAALTAARALVQQLSDETGRLMQERNMLERSVVERRAEVTSLEERLERARPRSRRVDMSPNEDGEPA